MVEPLNTKAAVEAFSVWWNDDGRFLDPDTSDVPWFDKREALAEYSYLAAASAAESRVQSLEEEVKKLTGLVERAFKDGLAYAGNVRNANPDIAWDHSAVRAALKENGNG